MRSRKVWIGWTLAGAIPALDAAPSVARAVVNPEIIDSSGDCAGNSLRFSVSVAVDAQGNGYR